MILKYKIEWCNGNRTMGKSEWDGSWQEKTEFRVRQTNDGPAWITLAGAVYVCLRIFCA